MTRMKCGWGVAVAALVIALGLFGFRPRTEAQPAASQTTAGAKYTVIDSEGTNLTVVDNATNTLYFYCVGQDKSVGDELQLRGSIDLNEVGKPSLTPKRGEAGR